MPSGAHSFARARARLATPALLAAYELTRQPPWNAITDAVITIAPPSSIARAAARATAKVDTRFKSMMRRKSERETSRAEALTAPPALQTHTSTRPRRSIARAVA